MNLIEKINAVLNKLSSDAEVMVAFGVCVLVFAVLYYYMMKFLFNNKAGVLIVLFVFVMLVGAVVLTFIDFVNTAIYLIIPAMFVIAIFVLYSVEVKRLLWAKKYSGDVKHGETSYDQ